VSLFPEGRDWWVASDGRWYAPEYHPEVVSRQAPSMPPPPTPGPLSLPPLGQPLPHPGSVAPPWMSAPGPRPPAAVPTSGGLPSPPRARRTSLTVGVVLVVLLAGIGVGVWLNSKGGTQQNASSTSNSVSPFSPSSPSTTQAGAGTSGGPISGSASGSAPAPGSTSVGGSSGTGTLPPVAPPAPPASGPLVTLSVAQQVFDTTWKPFANAFVDGDDVGMDRFTTPTVQHVIAAAFACGCRPWPTAYSQVSFTAPPQSTYPLSFYAEITGQDYDGTTQWRQVVFTQASATAPWLISFMGAFNEGSAILGTPATDTLAAPSPASAAMANADGAALATFLDHLDANTNPSPPPGFLVPGWLASVISEENQGLATETKDGDVSTTVHAVGTPSLTFAGPYLALECFPISFTATYRNANGTPLVQPQDQDGFGLFQAPGTFSSITQTGVNDWCLDSDGVHTEITTIWGGVYQSVGTPA